MDPYYIEPVEEILTEPPFGDLLFKVTIRGGYNPHVNLDSVFSPNPFEHFFLQHTENFYLYRLVYLADFVQKNGAAVGQFEPAAFP